MTSSNDDFVAVQVYHSESTASPDDNVQQVISEKRDITQEEPLSPRPVTHLPSLLSQSLDLTSTSVQKLVTPEMIQLYPKVDRDVTKKPKKGKQRSESRIYN